ncbi:MAG TPA: hypothetical protein VE621_07705 [Bryobacteraceae bacterium]|nr:hypothetical protein [Bryobacteraceae bacterium]
MHQVVTLALLVIFTMPIVQLFQPGRPQPKLPACCRRDGKHGCAMVMQTERARPGDGLAIRAAKLPCSSYPHGTSAPATTPLVVAGPIPVILPLPPRAIDAVSQTEALYRVSFSRSRQKRGPPSFVS